jgi:hypothetical protein
MNVEASAARQRDPAKAELGHRRVPWKIVASLELATPEWVTWFNHQRLLEPIGHILPIKAGQRYYF